MELNRIETILEKYFQGETSVSEEKELKNYFSSSDVAQHLEQYIPLFIYFSKVKEQEFKQTIPLQAKKRNVAWLSIAASVVVLLGISTFIYLYQPQESNDLGTYDNPEAAFEATQKALSLLSKNVNVGIESVTYINEFQNSKELIFKTK
jgi:7-cyano-7-deazaguanine synthase in queuosine biosynthesis